MQKRKSIGMFLLAGLFAGAFSVLAVHGQANPPQLSGGKDDLAQPPPASSSVRAATTRTRSPFTATQKSRHADNFYKGIWGVENLEVREAASGSLLRFSYRVTDANRAQTLNDKKATPYLIDEKTGAVLQVPVMPKVGMMRQTADPENGRDYWMVFSNKGVVKPGSRVDVVVGNFRANGLVVK